NFFLFFHLDKNNITIFVAKNKQEKKRTMLIVLENLFRPVLPSENLLSRSEKVLMGGGGESYFSKNQINNNSFRQVLYKPDGVTVCSNAVRFFLFPKSILRNISGKMQLFICFTNLNFLQHEG
ncbi:MAG: hypothetical protein LBK22_01445, partial [Tannerella sp.]|nr:hypothetical protein [Tannerella sp.]